MEEEKLPIVDIRAVNFWIIDPLGDSTLNHKIEIRRQGIDYWVEIPVIQEGVKVKIEE